MGKQKYGHLANLSSFTNITNKKGKAAKVLRSNNDSEWDNNFKVLGLPVPLTVSSSSEDKENSYLDLFREPSFFNGRHSPTDNDNEWPRAGEGDSRCVHVHVSSPRYILSPCLYIYIYMIVLMFITYRTTYTVYTMMTMNGKMSNEETTKRWWAICYILYNIYYIFRSILHSIYPYYNPMRVWCPAGPTNLKSLTCTGSFLYPWLRVVQVSVGKGMGDPKNSHRSPMLITTNLVFSTLWK